MGGMALSGGRLVVWGLTLFCVERFRSGWHAGRQRGFDPAVVVFGRPGIRLAMLHKWDAHIV